MENRNCFAYNKEKNICNALMVGTCRRCKFYMTKEERDAKFDKANDRLDKIHYKGRRWDTRKMDEKIAEEMAKLFNMEAQNGEQENV